MTVIHVYSETVIKPSLAVIDRASVRRRPLRGADLRGLPPHCAGRATPLSRRLEHNTGRAVPGLQRNPVPSRPPPGRREPNMTVLRSRGIGACDEGHPRRFSAYNSSRTRTSPCYQFCEVFSQGEPRPCTHPQRQTCFPGRRPARLLLLTVIDGY